MNFNSIETIEEVLHMNRDGVCRIPALVKGRLLAPPTLSIDKLRAAAESGSAAKHASGRRSQWFLVDGAQVLRHPILDRSSLTPTGDDQYLILPEPDPRSLIETDSDSLVHELFNIPFREVMEYVGALREVLRRDNTLISRVAEYTKATSLLDDRAFDILFDVLPQLLDPRSMTEAVERELGDTVASGARYLDEWVPVPAYPHRGATARMADQMHGVTVPTESEELTPRVRAMPTRQLHITAGNSLIVPFVSMLRAFATKSAALVKSPAESTAAAAILGSAMHEVDSEHPLTRHTSLVYWKGGDRRIEDELFAPGAFDRLVVWGSPETVHSVASRVGSTKVVFFYPRYGLSMIGHEAFPDGIETAAVRAATDAMVANQGACTSSLVHYVEATETEALEYCRVLKDVLARWDRILPHRLSPTVTGRLRRLRRSEFLHGTWFENGDWPHTTSLVVFMPTAFDLSAHPMSRCVVVRRVDDLRHALPFVHAGVSTVGVYPETKREELRDDLAVKGVSNIFPLGEGERMYAGMPHDGIRVLSELVNWTNA